jgi:hypothetical protein
MCERFCNEGVTTRNYGRLYFRLDIGRGSVAAFGSSKCIGVHGRMALGERV